MQQRSLGPGTPEVTAISFGGMPLSIQGRPDEEVGIRVVHSVIDDGVTLLDTADVYCLDATDYGHGLAANRLGGGRNGFRRRHLAAEPRSRFPRGACADSRHLQAAPGRGLRGANHGRCQSAQMASGPHHLVFRNRASHTLSPKIARRPLPTTIRSLQRKQER